MGIFNTDCEGYHRRDFLKMGSAGLLGLTLPNLLKLESQAKTMPHTTKGGKAKSVILVWLAGGPSTIDMWDLKPDAPETIRGEFKPIKTSVTGLHISEHLPKMANVMDQVTLVRSLAHPIPSHEIGTIWMTTGNKPTPALQYPSMGSVAAKLLPTAKGVPAYVSMSQLRGGKVGGAGYLGTSYNPFEVEGAADKGQLRVRGVSLPRGFAMSDLDNREKLLEELDSSFKKYDANDATGLDQFQQQAMDILRSDKTKAAFDLTTEKPATQELYGKTGFGQSAIAARRLVEAGVRFVTIGTGGWDTHRGNFNTLKTQRLPQLDQTLAALISDLKERGLLDSTIVMCAGEFGRTPTINKDGGRDHWSRSMSIILAGGGFHAGHVYGSTDEHGKVPASDNCTPDDIASTIFSNLNIDPKQELQTASKRPITLFREGKVLTSLVG